MVLLPGSAALVQPLSKKVPGISLLPNAAFNCRDRGDSPLGSHPGGGLSHREARGSAARPWWRWLCSTGLQSLGEEVVAADSAPA